MKKARIHIRTGVISLPKRTLEHGDVTDDIIEIDLNDNERVMQVDLEFQGGYIHRRETEEEAQKRYDRTRSPEVGALVRSMGGTHAVATADRKVISIRDKEHDNYKYRVATLEEYIAVDEDQTREMSTISDAEVVGIHDVLRKDNE